MFDTSRRKMLQALGIGGAATIAGCAGSAPQREVQNVPAQAEEGGAKEPDVDTVSADPRELPDPIDRDSPATVQQTLTTTEVTAEVEPGVTFDYMTFNEQIPGPMLRARVGDTIELTIRNPEDNGMPHNVDFHSVYGTGGGADATTVAPGEENAVRFRVDYPGAYIYHCAVPNMDYHISAGMFGMILVEPEGGLPEVDQELYFGQHELYTNRDTGEEGHHAFDIESMADEDPTYVLLNGEKYAWSAAERGPVEIQQDDTTRVYLVTGGPNLSSNFHPIGNVWSRAYRDGGLPEEALVDYADKNIQTMKVPPGSCMIGVMETPVPERIKLVDHALSRVARKGLLAEVDVLGEEDEAIYGPDWNGSTHEGPIYE